MPRPKGHPANSLISTLGNEVKWAGVDDRTAATQPARDKFNERFLNEAREKFPHVTDEADLARRAGHLRRAYYLRLALKSAQARRAKKAGAAG